MGQALIHDVDVADGYKKHPLPAEVRDVVEVALEVYVDSFADLSGSRDHVLLLDSVGGAYPMIPPAATAPLAEEFPADRDRGLLYEELCTRVDEWLADVWTEVQETVSGAAECLDPDDINNKNRQYKTVLSVKYGFVECPEDGYYQITDVGEQYLEGKIDASKLEEDEV